MDRSILIFLLLVHLNLPSQLIAQEIMVNQQEEGGIQNSTIRTKDKPPVESGAEGEYEEAQERIGGSTLIGFYPRTAIITELVGLSTLKGFALLTFPLLIPVFLAALAILILPLPIFSTPIAAIGRRLGSSRRSTTTMLEEGAAAEHALVRHQEIDDILGEIVQSSKCLERISCEIGRSVKSPQVRAIIDQAFRELSGQLIRGRWNRALQGYIIGSNGRMSTKNLCVKFKCKLGKNL